MKTIKEWKIIDVIKWAESYLDKKGFENPKTEIEWLLGSLLGYSRLDLYLKFDKYGVLASKNLLNKENMNKVDFSEMKTNSQLSQKSFVEKFLSSIKEKMYRNK